MIDQMKSYYRSDSKEVTPTTLTGMNEMGGSVKVIRLTTGGTSAMVAIKIQMSPLQSKTYQ
jgi:plastocyanin domain-containing protein